MRCIGQLADAAHARRFSAWLATKGVESRIDQADDEWHVWVFDEDQVAAAEEELEEFCQLPDHERYAIAADQQQETQQRALEAEFHRRKREISQFSRRAVRPMWQRFPVVYLLLFLCGVVTAVSHFGRDRELTNPFRIATVDADGKYLVSVPIDPQGKYKMHLPEIFWDGQLWRLVTPIFIHMDPLHLLFNMYWLYQFGVLIELRSGSLRLLLMVVVFASFSNVAQYLLGGPMFEDGAIFSRGGPTFGGMSGVGHALFGYHWFRTYFDPDEEMHLDPSVTMLFYVWMVLCMTPLIPNVANMAHIAGLVCGVLWAGAGRGIRVLRN